MVDAIRDSLEAQKALDLAVIDLSGKSDIADYMVIASGNSRRQVVSMAERLMEALRTLGLKGLRPEGLAQGDWVLLDAGDVIVHLFRPEVRAFYSLEKMWDVEFPDSREPAAV